MRNFGVVGESNFLLKELRCVIDDGFYQLDGLTPVRILSKSIVLNTNRVFELVKGKEHDEITLLQGICEGSQLRRLFYRSQMTLKVVDFLTILLERFVQVSLEHKVDLFAGVLLH